MIGFSRVIDFHAHSKQWIISDARGFDIDVVYVDDKFRRVTYYQYRVKACEGPSASQLSAGTP